MSDYGTPCTALAMQMSTEQPTLQWMQLVKGPCKPHVHPIQQRTRTVERLTAQYVHAGHS